jgi:hypothetical protein
MCRATASIKHGSWFQKSKLTFLEILLITYDIVCREPAHRIQNELSLGKQTVTDWGMFRRETMLVFLEGCSEKIGGPNQTVQIDESKFGRRKYHRGHPVQGQWVLGGIERGSGRLFLVPVPDRTADTLEAIIRDRIEPGTRVISDCWGANKPESLGYTRRTVNRSLHFMHPDTGDHTNTTESTWHCIKLFLGPYNRREEYVYHLAHYMFVARCIAQGIPPFLQFLHLVANTDWSQVDLPLSSDPAT